MPAAPPRLIERSVHAVAALEWLKGLAALALAFGFDTLHRLGLHEVAVALVGHLHLNAHSHWPALFVGWSDHLQHVHPGQVVAFALAYAAMRLAEGWGLWHDCAWAEWLAALATGIYLPFEAAHWLHRPGWAAALVLGFNLAVLALMVWRLRGRRASA